MVVPLNSTSEIKNKTKRIIGDGKKIILRTNSDSLLVIGSGNLLEIERNDGEIQVVGDGCRISVNTGSGTIKYTGDGGYVKTGNMDLNKVVYEGDGGRVISGNGATRSCNTSEKLKTTSTFYVNNKNNINLNVPSAKKFTCIHVHVPVPKVMVFTTRKCKHNH